jgi:hypothetical protein
MILAILERRPKPSVFMQSKQQLTVLFFGGMVLDY